MAGKMRVVVHRGTHEIGAACIEVTTENTRIIFDAGLPLESSDKLPLKRPCVSGLWSTKDGKIDALFLTHAHADHSGLVGDTDDSIPVYLTQETSKILLAGALFARQPKIRKKRMHQITPRTAVAVGDLRVTAFEVDHSTVGAVVFLVECADQRIFYSGDFRFHGRRPELARELEEYLCSKPVDVMLIEGTRLGNRASERNESEAELLDRLVNRCKAHGGPIFVSYSPLHVDRFRTFHDLALRIGRRFVIDPYQDFVLHLLRGDLPRPTKNGQLCTVLMKEGSAPFALTLLRKKSWISNLRRHAHQPQELRTFWDQAIILYRPSMDEWMFSREYPVNGLFLYSYWSGYLEQKDQKAWISKINKSGALLENAHVSGHAHPDDLVRFVNKVNPRILVPVHTEHPEAWTKHYAKTRVLKDGEILHV